MFDNNWKWFFGNHLFTKPNVNCQSLLGLDRRQGALLSQVDTASEFLLWVPRLTPFRKTSWPAVGSELSLCCVQLWDLTPFQTTTLTLYFPFYFPRGGQTPGLRSLGTACEVAEKASVLSLALLRAAALGAHEGGEARRGVPVAVPCRGRGRAVAVAVPCRSARRPVGAGRWQCWRVDSALRPSAPERSRVKMAFRVGKVGGWMDGWREASAVGPPGFSKDAAPQGRAAKRDRNPLRGAGGGGRKREHMCAMHLFGATQPANHPPHHSVPGETLLRNDLCYSRERGLCFCATWRKHEMVFPLRTSACVNQLGEDPKPLTLADSDQSRLSPPLPHSSTQK